MWIGERFVLQSVNQIAWPAGDCPRAVSMHGTEGYGDTVFVEPPGDFAVSPMLAAQGEDGFAMRLQFAARSALLLGFG